MIRRWGSVIVGVSVDVSGSIGTGLEGGEEVTVAMAEGEGNAESMMLATSRGFRNGFFDFDSFAPDFSGLRSRLGFEVSVWRRLLVVRC